MVILILSCESNHSTQLINNMNIVPQMRFFLGEIAIVWPVIVIFVEII